MWTRAVGADAGLVRSGAASRLRIEQVRRDDHADVGIADQDWVGAVQTDHVGRDVVADRVLRIAGDSKIRSQQAWSTEPVSTWRRRQSRPSSRR